MYIRRVFVQSLVGLSKKLETLDHGIFYLLNLYKSYSKLYSGATLC